MGCGSSTSNTTNLPKQDPKTNVGPEKQGQGGNTDKSVQPSAKLLLLGAGGSGKSTVFKQIKRLYGEAHTDQERAKYKWTIHANVLNAMKVLCVQSKQFSNISEANRPSRDAVMAADDEAPISEELGVHVARLWGDPGIRETYEMRSRFQLPTDIIHYFFNNVENVCKKDYLPSAEDIVHCRIHSTGVQEAVFPYQGVNVHILDVGGQRSERKKWVACFQQVTCVLFVAAISEYNQMLYEDEDVNRLTEALDVFENIVNSDLFTSTGVVLLLNKRDLFQQKIAQDPLSKYFPDFPGPDDYETGVEWIKATFEARNEQERGLFVHLTMATESANVREVFEQHVRPLVLHPATSPTQPLL